MRISAPGITCITGALTVALVGPLAYAALEREQFVAGWPIELPSDGTFFDFPISDEIYRYGRTLNELAVLDGNGEPMPFYRVTVPSPVASEERTTLGVSPIYVQQPDQGIADITVTTEDDRTGVNVTRTDADNTEPEVVAFIIDASDVETAPSAIELEWQPLDRPFLMSVSLEHSEALTGWRSVGRGSVASLSIDSMSVTHGRIAIAGREGGYYRVTWDRRISDWQLEQVVLVSSRVTESATFRSIDLAPIENSAVQASANSLYFDVGGELPTTSADLVFPSENRWANASISSANAVDGPWRQLTSQRLFYDISYENERFESLPFDFGRVESRYWRVTFFPDLPSEPVELRLRYPEERLRFAANGEPPYILTGGTLSDEAGPDSTFAAVMNALDPDQRQVSAAQLGARVVLGGDMALEIPTEFPWRTVLLWGTLLVAGLTVGWMAVRLAREMTTKA